MIESVYDNDIKSMEIRPCFDCMMGRMRALPSGESTHHDWGVMEKIAIDYKGPFSIQSTRKKKGVMLISDYYSNFVHAYPVRLKSEAVEALEDFFIKFVHKYDYKIKVLQSDADCIFMSKRIETWLKKHDIALQLSAPYVHSQNGQIERDVQNVFDKARTLMVGQDVPPKYWEYAVKTATYIINRSPTRGREVTPIEAVTKIKPNIANLYPFWSPGVCHVTRDQRGKNPWDPKAEECRLLGYDEDAADAFIVLLLRTKRVVTRANCIFDTQYIMEELDEEPEEIDIGEGRDDIDLFKEMRLENEQEVIDINDEELELEPMDVVPVTEVNDHDVTAEKGYKDDDEMSGITDSETLSDSDMALLFSYWNSESYWMVSSVERWWNDMKVLALIAKPLPPNPSNIDEALAGPDGEKWRKAISDEWYAFELRKIWKRAAEQFGRAMKTKLLLIYKYGPDYEIKCKARLVVCGYSQIKGIDYNDTYSPTTTTPVVFYLLHYCSTFHMHMAIFDVSSAYLEGEADVKMYAWLPKELCADEIPVRVEILGNWYGEKQAGRIWNQKFDGILVKNMGFVRCPMMPCLYKWTDGVDTLLMTVHVDDGLMICNNPDLFPIFMKELLTHIKKAILSTEFDQYLKMAIHKEADGRISIDQSDYIINNFPNPTRNVLTPTCTSINLRKQEPNINNESLLPDTGKYRYLADRARADILVATSEISIGGATAPSDEHVRASQRLKDYLYNTKDMKLILGSNTNKIELFGYSDAAYITDGNAKSRLGGCLFLGPDSGAFMSFSRSDTIKSSICHSSTEAEIKAIDELVREIEYWLEILEFTGVKTPLPVKIFVDNRSAIELCRVLKTTHQVKHINTRIHYINDMIMRGLVQLLFVPGEYNVADLLTKGLPRESHDRHTEILMHGHGGVIMHWLESNAVHMSRYFQYV